MSKFKALLQAGLVVLGVAIVLGSILDRQQFQAEAGGLSPTNQIEWMTIADGYYGYSFQIPAAWYKEMGVTPDRWVFYGELAGGLIKVDFAADPVGHWLPDPETRNPAIDERGTATSEALVPLLPPGDWTKVGKLPALIVRQRIEEGGGPFTESTSIYILAERMVYYLWIGYAPPVGADSIARSQFLTTAPKIERHILESFAATLEQER